MRGIEITKEISETTRKLAELQARWADGFGRRDSAEQWTRDQEEMKNARLVLAELNKDLAANQRLQQAGITDTEAVRKAESELTKQRDQLAAAGKAVYEATRTPLEKLSAEHERLNQLLRQGAIDESTRSRAMFAAIETYDATLKKQQAPEEKDRSQLFGDLTKLEESLLSENERMRLHYEDQQFIVEDAFQTGLVSQQERYALLEGLEAQHQKKLFDTRYQGLSASDALAVAFREKDVKSALKFGAQMTAGAATQNKQLFEINKAFALADAAVSLPHAVLSSFEKAGGYPWGLIPAGMMLATGAAQISAISSASFGGGASAPSLVGAGGGGSTVNTVPVGAPQPIATAQQQQPVTKHVTVTFEGIADKNSVRQLMQQINEELGDGVKLDVA